MKLAIVLLIVAGIAGLSSAAPHKKVTKQDLLGNALRYASGLFAEEQDDDDDDDLADLLANLQEYGDDLMAELQDDDDDDAKLASFWKKALGHGLKYASGFFANKEDDDPNPEPMLQEDDDDDVNLESFWSKIPWKKVAKHGLKYASDIFATQQDEQLTDLLAKVQADADSLGEVLSTLQEDDDDSKVQSFWKKALGHGLKYASGLFAKEEMDDNNGDPDALADLIAKLQEDDDDDVNLESFWSKIPWKKVAKHGLKYASDIFATQQDEELTDLLAKVQADADSLGEVLSTLQEDDDDSKVQSFWKKALGHGLKYASGFFANKEQNTPEVYDNDIIANLQDDDDDDDSLEDLLAKLQEDDDDDAKLASFWKKALHHGLNYAAGLFADKQDDMPGPAKSLAEELLEKLTKNE